MERQQLALSEKQWKTFLKKLDLQKNIFDILVLFYSYIDGKKKPQYEKDYYQLLEELPENYWGDLLLLYDELVHGTITFLFFVKKLKENLRKDNIRYVAFFTLFQFEEYIKGREELIALMPVGEELGNKCYSMGPLNKVNNKYAFYYMPEAHYFKDKNSHFEQKIRFLEQSEFSRIDKRILHYKIVKRERLPIKIDVKAYKQKNWLSVSQNGLRIALVPTAPFLWYHCKFEEYPKGDKYYFQLDEREELADKMNSCYVTILSRCMKEEVKIVVFPELARNHKTLKIVKDFLVQKTLEGKNPLELIFLGSLWENGKNEGVLLSGTGKVLLENKKMNAFWMERNGKKYWEDLQELPHNMVLLDMPGLGRIQYLICKDGLNDSFLSQIWSVFELSFLVVSSYSNSVHYFKDIGEKFSQQYAGIEILANACAARLEGMENLKCCRDIGYVSVPAKEEKNCAASETKVYASSEYCKEECLCECIRVFQIIPKDSIHDTQIYEETIHMDSNCL